MILFAMKFFLKRWHSFYDWFRFTFFFYNTKILYKILQIPGFVNINHNRKKNRERQIVYKDLKKKWVSSLFLSYIVITINVSFPSTGWQFFQSIYRQKHNGLTQVSSRVSLKWPSDSIVDATIIKSSYRSRKGSNFLFLPLIKLFF